MLVAVVALASLHHVAALRGPFAGAHASRAPAKATREAVDASPVEQPQLGGQQQQQPGLAVCRHGRLTLAAPEPGPPRQAITVDDVTARVQAFVTEVGLREGHVTLVTQHTTTAVTINEYETRLANDLRRWLLSVAPADRRSAAAAPGATVTYAHNDIDQRPDGEAERRRCQENGWDVDDPQVLEAWRAQEPINAHAHLLAMLLGATLSVPVSDGRLLLGQWQSILSVDLDGPRDRCLVVSAIGFS